MNAVEAVVGGVVVLAVIFAEPISRLIDRLYRGGESASPWLDATGQEEGP